MLKRMSAKIPPNPPLKKGGARSAGGFSRAGLPAALLAALTLAGCAVGPTYQRPEVPIPAQWQVDIQTANDLANTTWWNQFQDPVLDNLIQIALQENKDVQIAAARVEEYMGRYGVTRSAQFPQVGANAAGARTRSSENGALPPGDKPDQHLPGGSGRVVRAGPVGQAAQRHRGGSRRPARHRGSPAHGDPDPGQSVGQQLCAVTRLRQAVGHYPSDVANPQRIGADQPPALPGRTDLGAGLPAGRGGIPERGGASAASGAV